MALDQYNFQVQTDYLSSNPANQRYLEASMASLRDEKDEDHNLIES